ncbi:Protein PBDC1 [Madurella mycetomatis]|uniref:Protein PBDC1 n=1 Tax=Madurella mycetomatis TaxID=100816 RepID=A0A175VSW5_9PEZI|nr:Protein PBDC1 [Madurella mycetomatis]
MSAPAPKSFNAEEAENLEDIEKQFAVKVVQHMQTYWAILEKVKGSSIEDEMKSKSGKERWRNFMMAYEKKVDDYNFGTILRSNPKFEYGQEETIFVPRMQFYAVEIARNRLGLNDWIYEKAQQEKAEASKSSA